MQIREAQYRFIMVTTLIIWLVFSLPYSTERTKEFIWLPTGQETINLEMAKKKFFNCVDEMRLTWNCRRWSLCNNEATNSDNFNFFIKIIAVGVFFNLLPLKGRQSGCLSWPFSNVCLLLNHIVCFNQTLYKEHLGSGFFYVCENDKRNLLLLLELIRKMYV